MELRRGILTNSRLALTSAWTRFDQVVRVHPDWPYARLGLAVAALEIYSRRYPLPADYDDVAGGTHYDGFTIQMKRTLRTEPTFQPAINWLASTLSEEGDRDQPRAILEALQFIADSTNSTDPRVQLILARAERLHGDATQSVPRIDAYLREGGDAGVAELELARSFAWMGDLDNAATEYMAGAAVQTAEGRAIYRLDLSWVATPRELARFDSLPVRLDCRVHRPFLEQAGRAGAPARREPPAGASPALGVREPELPRARSGPAHGIQGSLHSLQRPSVRRGRRATPSMITTTPSRRARAPTARPSASSIIAPSSTCGMASRCTSSAAAPDSLSYLATNRAYPRLDDYRRNPAAPDLDQPDAIYVAESQPHAPES